MELDPSGSQGVFTVIADLNGDITMPELTRAEEEVTPHDDTIDSWVLGVFTRGPLTFGLNYVFNNNTHDHATGLIKAIIDNETRGFRLRGPSGTTDTDEWIMSGAVQNVGPVTNPVRSGARQGNVTVRLSGPMKIDGTIVGTVTS
jgi:hypothetical protein